MYIRLDCSMLIPYIQSIVHHATSNLISIPGAVLDRRPRDQQPALRGQLRDDLRGRRLVVLQLVRLVADHQVDARVRHLVRMAPEGLVGHDEHLRSS